MTTRPAHAAVSDRLPDHHALTPPRPNPLLTVMRWELRRSLANRSTRILAVLLFAVCVALLGLSLQQTTFDLTSGTGGPGGPTRELMAVVTRNSLFGLTMLLPFTLVEFALFLPFVTADGVSLDLKRRTHELLMTTALPTRAYIWGRYFADMLIALGMACVYLVALVAVAVTLHLWAGGYYPAINVPGAVVFWAVLVLPPTILIGSLCFALGVLLPHRSTVIKAGAVFGWLCIGLLLQGFTYDKVRNSPGFAVGNPPAWWRAYETWQPTNTDSGSLFTAQFTHHLNAIFKNLSLNQQAMQRQVETLQGQLPDLNSFMLAHLVWIVFGLAAVAFSSLAFRRFRNVVV